MAVILTKKIIEEKENNTQKPIDKIDFISYFTDEQKNNLIQPITTNEPTKKMYEISKFALAMIDN